MKQEEGWVVCRVFKKKLPSMRRMSEHESPCWYDEHVSFMPDLDSPNHNNSNSSMNNQMAYHGHFPNYPCKKELDHLPFQHHVPNEHFFQLPLLDSPKLLLQSSASAAVSSNSMTAAAAYSIDINQNFHAVYGNNSNELQAVDDDQLTDWRVLDKFVASQLSQDDVSKGNSYSWYSTGTGKILTMRAAGNASIWQPLVVKLKCGSGDTLKSLNSVYSLIIGF